MMFFVGGSPTGVSIDMPVEFYCQPLAIVPLQKNTNYTSSPTENSSREVPYGVKNPLWLAFSVRFSRLRIATGLSGIEVARLAGFNPAHGYRLEAGTRTPGIDLVERAARALSVSPVWLGYGPEGHLPYKPRRIPGTVDLDYPPPVPHEVLDEEVYRHAGCGERMRQRRQALGLSLRDLVKVVNEPADEVRVSYMTVYNTEIGASMPRLNSVESIAVALDVPPGWLAFGDDPS